MQKERLDEASLYTLVMSWFRMEARQYAVLGKRCLCFCFHKKKLWILSKLIKTRFDQGRPEILALDEREEARKEYKTGAICADPSA